MELEQEEWLQAFYRHDYLECARIGLQELKAKEKVSYQLLLLLLVSLERTGYEPQYNNLAPQVLDSLSKAPWIKILAQLIMGKIDLTDAIDSAINDEQLAQAYCYAGIRYFTLRKMRDATEVFLECLGINSKCWENTLARAEIAFAQPVDSKGRFDEGNRVDKSVNLNHLSDARKDSECSKCGGLYWHDIWSIVDIEQRPDLVRRIYNGTIHHDTCPHCGESKEIEGIPLLLFRHSGRPHFIYSKPLISRRNAGIEEEDGEVRDSLLMPKGVRFLIKLFQENSQFDSDRMAELVGSLYPSARFPDVGREELSFFLKGLGLSNWALIFLDEIKSKENLTEDLEKILAVSGDSLCVFCGIQGMGSAVAIKENRDWLNTGTLGLFIICEHCAKGVERDILLASVLSITQ